MRGVLQKGDEDGPRVMGIAIEAGSVICGLAEANWLVDRVKGVDLFSPQID